MNKSLEREQMFLEMLYEKNEIIKQLTNQIDKLKKEKSVIENNSDFEDVNNKIEQEE